jgi:hypothetical protein
MPEPTRKARKRKVRRSGGKAAAAEQAEASAGLRCYINKLAFNFGRAVMNNELLLWNVLTPWSQMPAGHALATDDDAASLS